jgi:hypothetical protein
VRYSATIQSLDPAEAEQERLRQLIQHKPKAYQDKVMSAEALPVADSTTEPTEAEPSGFCTYSLESRAGFTESQLNDVKTQQSSEAGVRAEYRFETENYGEMVGQVDARTPSNAEGREAQSVRVTARNLGLPLTPETLADTSVGDINSEVTDAFGRSYRLSLGTSPVRGVGTHVYNATTDLRAGSGKRGELLGGPYPSFTATQGELSWLGYTRKLTDKVTAGVQVNQAQNVSATTKNVRSIAASAKYGQAARVTVVQSQTDSVDGKTQDANGVFVESSIREGRYQHELGVYAADPDLRFGDNRLTANSRGAYWRVDRADTRLNVGGGVDVQQDSATGNAQRVSVDSNAQYRVDARRSLGGRLHVSNTQSAAVIGDNSRSINGSGFYQVQTKGWGRSRINATLHRNETVVANGVAATGDELQWEQDWVTGKYDRTYALTNGVKLWQAS